MLLVSSTNTLHRCVHYITNHRRYLISDNTYIPQKCSFVLFWSYSFTYVCLQHPLVEGRRCLFGSCRFVLISFYIDAANCVVQIQIFILSIWKFLNQGSHLKVTPKVRQRLLLYPSPTEVIRGFEGWFSTWHISPTTFVAEIALPRISAGFTF